MGWLRKTGAMVWMAGVFLSTFLAPRFVLAVNPGDNGPVSLPNPLGDGCNDLSCPLNAVINFLYTIAIPLCAIMVLVGGFQMVTAGGDPERFSNGRKTILYAAIGFAVILVAGGISTLIKNFLSS